MINTNDSNVLRQCVDVNQKGISSQILNLSVLWGKKPKEQTYSSKIIPLQDHLKKTVEVAVYLWNEWLPQAVKNQIDLRILKFLTYVHDVGKVSPVFQFREGILPCHTQTKWLSRFHLHSSRRTSWLANKRRPVNRT